MAGPAARMTPVDVLIKEKHLGHFNFWNTHLQPGSWLWESMRFKKLQKKQDWVFLYRSHSDPRHYFSNNIFLWLQMECHNGRSSWVLQQLTT
ncbi:MAG: hypothetical protein IPJ13_32180 [Saprospiraceae bacterium]|nr:hypothetical protein [Saprospiraceae bacterium]